MEKNPPSEEAYEKAKEEYDNARNAYVNIKKSEKEESTAQEEPTDSESYIKKHRGESVSDFVSELYAKTGKGGH